jgi:hypothetical protein
MTDADRAALKALVEQWRAESGSWEPGIGSGIEMCADELSALIAAGLSEAPAFEYAHGVARDMWCNLCNRQLDALCEAPAPQEKEHE